jgi:hypothetical protein
VANSRCSINTYGSCTPLPEEAPRPERIPFRAGAYFTWATRWPLKWEYGGSNLVIVGGSAPQLLWPLGARPHRVFFLCWLGCFAAVSAAQPCFFLFLSRFSPFCFFYLFFCFFFLDVLFVVFFFLFFVFLGIFLLNLPFPFLLVSVHSLYVGLIPLDVLLFVPFHVLPRKVSFRGNPLVFFLFWVLNLYLETFQKILVLDGFYPQVSQTPPFFVLFFFLLSFSLFVVLLFSLLLFLFLLLFSFFLFILIFLFFFLFFLVLLVLLLLLFIYVLLSLLVSSPWWDLKVPQRRSTLWAPQLYLWALPIFLGVKGIGPTGRALWAIPISIPIGMGM